MNIVPLLVLFTVLWAVPAAAQLQPGTPFNPWECRPTWAGTECSTRWPSSTPLAPGSPLNPYRGTPTPNGGTDWQTPLPGRDPLAPGSPLNPIRCRETWGGRIECSSGF